MLPPSQEPNSTLVQLWRQQHPAEHVQYDDRAKQLLLSLAQHFKPTGPVTPLVLFQHGARAKMKQQNPDLNPRQMDAIGERLWHGMSPREKSVFMAMSHKVCPWPASARIVAL